MDKNHQDNYKNHRSYWRSKDFLKTLFGENVKLDSIKVLEFLDKIDSIPESHIFTIAAYGSLLNDRDILRTLPSAHNLRVGHLIGYQRIFDMGTLETGCVLNIRYNEESSIICNLIDIDYKDLPYYILREGWYNIEILDKKDYYDSQEFNNNPVITVIGKEDIINNSIGVEPQLNYLHMCLTGIKELAGWEGVQNFLNDTLCYSNEEKDYIPVRDWLDNLDIVNYIITKTYNNR